MKLYMVEVRVSDLARSVAFYRDVLGLAIRMEDPNGDFALLGDGATHVALKVGEVGRRERDSTRLVFEVSDLDAERARLQDFGIAVGEAVENAAEEYREARLHDPDGTPIGLFEWGSRRSNSAP